MNRLEWERRVKENQGDMLMGALIIAVAVLFVIGCVFGITR